MKPIIHFLFILTIISSYCCAQKDSIKPIMRNSDYTFGVFAGLTVNPWKNTRTKYSPMSNSGAYPLSNYKDRIFLNSFSNNMLIPSIGFDLVQNKSFAHAFSMSYFQEKFEGFVSIYYSNRKTQTVFHEYNMCYFFLANRTEKILPFIGATISSSHENLMITYTALIIQI